MELRVAWLTVPYLGLLSAERTGMCLHSPHTFTCVSGWEVCHSVQAPCFLYLPICWHQSTVICFPILVIVRNVRMSMCRQLSFQYTDFISLRETAGWYSSSNSSLVKRPRTAFHKGCKIESLRAAPLCILTVCCCPIFLETAVWTGMRWYLSTVLTSMALLVRGTSFCSHLTNVFWPDFPKLTNFKKNFPVLPGLSLRHAW